MRAHSLTRSLALADASTVIGDSSQCAARGAPSITRATLGSLDSQAGTPSWPQHSTQRCRASHMSSFLRGGTNQPTNQSQQYIRTSLALLSESAAIMQQIQDAAASGAVTLVDTTRPTHSQQAVDDDGDASRAANQPEQDAHTTATTLADTTTTHGPADGTAIQHAASSTIEQRHGPSRQTTTETTRSASKYVPMYV